MALEPLEPRVVLSGMVGSGPETVLPAESAVLAKGGDTKGYFSLDIDGNGASAALTDSLLTLRYLFAFTGQSLTFNALGPGATRTDPAEIEQYLNDNRTWLDVDLDGQLNGLIDGVLIARYVFGYRGADLTNGSLGCGATRTDPADIATYLDGCDVSGDMPPYAQGLTQTVTADPAAVSLPAGGTVTASVLYNTSNGSGRQTGLGLRIHYDSSKVAVVGEDMFPARPRCARPQPKGGR
jgi:hypothetical protein